MYALFPKKKPLIRNPWNIENVFSRELCLVHLSVSFVKGYVGCATGATFVAITLAVGVVTTGVSLLESVGVGLLPPSILFAHR